MLIILQRLGEALDLTSREIRDRMAGVYECPTIILGFGTSGNVAKMRVKLNLN